MKASITRILLASSLALGVASLAHAQPAPGSAERPGAQRMSMDGHGHGAMHGRGMGRMFGELNLTEAQRDQIFKIHHDQAPAFREQAKKVRAAREELHKLASADRLDEAAVRRAADGQAKAISDLAVMHAQTHNRVRSVLTPEQRAQFDKLREQRRGHGPRHRG